MERVTLSTPSLFADHHVLRARKALLALSGVQEVIASSMYRDVTIDFDPSKVDVKTIEKTIEDAGYPIGVEPELSGLVDSKDDGSPWFTIQGRKTTTVMADLMMSGDFRKY